MPPIKGEKWVATKWIHESPYQIVETPKPEAEEVSEDPFEDNSLSYSR